MSLLYKLDLEVSENSRDLIYLIHIYNKISKLKDNSFLKDEIESLRLRFEERIYFFEFVTELLELKIDQKIFHIDTVTVSMFKKSFVGSTSTYKRKFYKIKNGKAKIKINTSLLPLIKTKED